MATSKAGEAFFIDAFEGTNGITFSDEAPNSVAGEFGLDLTSSRAYLHVRTHQTLELTSSRDSVSAISPVWRRTSHVDTFKSWVGVDDAACPGESVAQQYWPLPSRPWTGRSFADSQELSAQERADIEAAGYAYIFGDSSRVASYRSVIERLTGSFELAIYMAREVRIEAGAVLRIHGAPALVLFERLHIVEGGQLLVNAPSRIHVGEMIKLSAGGN